MLSLLFFLVFGFVVGLIARALMPGEQRMGIAMTTLLGVVGSFVGGMLVSLVGHQRFTDFNTAGVVGSVIGAVAVLFVGVRLMTPRGTTIR